MTMIEAGSKVFHSLHGVGTVISIEEKVVLGQPTTFSVSSFGDDGVCACASIFPINRTNGIPKVDAQRGESRTDQNYH